MTNSVSDVTHLFLKWQFCFWCKGFVFVGPIFLMWRFWFWCKEFVSVVTNLFLTEWRFYFWCEKFVFVETNLFDKFVFDLRSFVLLWGNFFSLLGNCFWCAEFVFSLWWIWFCCEGFVLIFRFVSLARDLFLLKRLCFWSDDFIFDLTNLFLMWRICLYCDKFCLCCDEFVFDMPNLFLLLLLWQLYKAKVPYFKVVEDWNSDRVIWF